jgi:hypothetical protein
MEIVSADPADLVARRAHKAFRRIGKVDEYDAASFVEGRVNVDGYTAYMTVEWKPHRDGERVKVDIAASSNDSLSRAADSAMYLFLDTFKAVTPEELEKKDPLIPPAVVKVIITIAVLAAVYFFLQWLGNPKPPTPR